MIKFNAADRVTIDGRIGSRRNMLVFANASNSYTAADVQLMTPTASTNGSRDFAIFNTSFWGWTGLLRLDVFQGNPTNVHGGYAIAIGGTTVGTSGANHDSIIIENNIISGIGRGIFSGATAAANSNDTLIIRNNTFGGFSALPAFIVQERGVEATRVNSLFIEDNQFLNIIKDAPQFTANQSFGASLNTCNFITFNNNQFRNISNFSAQANGVVATACTNMSMDRNSFNRIYAPFSNAFGINLGANTANVTVTKNYIANVIANSNLNSTAVGIEVATNLTTANIKLHNNMIANVVGRGQAGPNASIAGIRLTNTNGNIEILHNSVGLSGVYQGTGNRVTAALAIGTPVTTLNVQNNIFANELFDLSTGGGTSRSYAVHCLSTAAGAFGTLGGINFNNYWVGTTPGVGQFFTGFLGGINRASVSDWSAATGYDAQSFSIDPEFVSNTDLHAQSTIMNDRGTIGFLPQVPQDIDNQNRPFSGSILPDVGADDYTPLSIDLAANGWVNPVGTCFTGLNPVQIRVKNYGSGSGSTVNLVLVPGVTEITVTGIIIYPSGLSTPYSRTFNTGSIPPSGTMILDLFPGGLDLTAEGTYTFLNFQAYVTGDQNLGNNVFSTFVINNRRPNVTVTASPSKFNQCIDNNATVRARVETRPYFFTQNVSQAIVDWGTTVSTLNVTLPPGVTANDLDTVTINLLHTWNSDLRIRLQAPDGTIYRICDGIGGNGDNFVNAQFCAGGIIPPAGNYTVRSLPSPPFSPYVPLDPFTSYSGTATGVWRLIIDDLFFQDDGTLLNWRLSFRNDVNVNWVVTGATPLPVLTPLVPTTVTSVWTDNENFTFTSAGTRTFKLQVVDAFGCAASAEADIEAELANTPDAPTIPDTIRVCKGARAVIEPKYASDSRAQFAFHIDNVRDTLFAAAKTKQIPDLSEVRDTINAGIPVQIPASELVAVNVDIMHPRVGDLQLYLISPSGVSVTLSLNNGGNGANYTNTMFTPYASDPISAGTPPFSRRYLPQQPFTLFTGNAQGNWQLRIVDTSAIGGTQGYLVGWSLQFRSQFLVASRYITGPLFEDTVIWVSTVLGKCLSKTMRGVAIEVLPQPNIPQPLTLPRICAGQQITINPRFNDSDKVFDRTFYWFRSQQDSLPFHIGTSYTTPKLTASETYFIATVFSGCHASPRRQIQVDVNPYPDLPIVPFAEACFGQSGTLVATSGTPGVRYNWYQSEDAPTPFFSGSIYLTSPAFKDSIFWVESFDGGCPSEKRVSVKLTVKPNPDAPKIIKADTFVCIGSRANMYAFSNSTVEWYDLEIGGTLLKKGADFDTIVDQNTTFWAQSKLGNCVSKRVPVTIRVGAKQPPLAVPTLPAVACKGGTTNLTARVDSGSTIWWFRDRQSAVRFIDGVVGNSYQTPFMNESDTFWIVTNNGICRSAPVPVPVSVEPEPTIRLSIAGGSPTVAQRQNFTVVASVEPKGSKIIWELAPGVDYYTKSDSELVVAFNNIGKQSIRVRALNGECEKVVTSSVEVLAQTGVVDKIVGVDFRVYPNPTRGMTLLQLNQEVSKPFTIEIIDGAGKQVYNESVDATNSYEKQYDFSKLGAGVYTVILRRESASLISRIVVQ
jgi:subtilisin-like proprotein convertase family protein